MLPPQWRGQSRFQDPGERHARGLRPRKMRPLKWRETRLNLALGLAALSIGLCNHILLPWGYLCLPLSVASVAKGQLACFESEETFLNLVSASLCHLQLLMIETKAPEEAAEASPSQGFVFSLSSSTRLIQPKIEPHRQTSSWSSAGAVSTRRTFPNIPEPQ